MLQAFLALSLATKVFYVFVIAAALVNGLMVFAPRISLHWRYHFAYTALVLTVYAFYILLRLASVLDAKDYLVLVQWLFPCLLFPMIMPALLIRWQSKYYKEALERRSSEFESDSHR